MTPEQSARISFSSLERSAGLVFSTEEQEVDGFIPWSQPIIDHLHTNEIDRAKICSSHASIGYKLANADKLITLSNKSKMMPSSIPLQVNLAILDTLERQEIIIVPRSGPAFMKPKPQDYYILSADIRAYQHPQFGDHIFAVMHDITNPDYAMKNLEPEEIDDSPDINKVLNMIHQFLINSCWIGLSDEGFPLLPPSNKPPENVH